VTITGINDAPIANVDPNNYIAFRGSLLRADDADGTNTPGFPGDDGVLLNDTDAEMDELTAVLVQRPSFARTGGFTLYADGTFDYIHNGGPSEVDTFQYQARDENGALSQQIVTVVINIDDAPPAEWQNPVNRYDVNNDGAVSPIDVLLVINYINSTSDPVLPDVRPIGAPFLDVNGDGNATPEDVLLVINRLNELNRGLVVGRAAGQPLGGRRFVGVDGFGRRDGHGAGGRSGSDNRGAFAWEDVGRVGCRRRRRPIDGCRLARTG
jgi:hypothetical protein